MLSEKARAFLEERRFAVLATHRPDGRIQQTVMWYELRGDTIMMNTTSTRAKARNLRQDPRVSVCLEEGYKFLSIEGSVSEIIDDHDIAVSDILSLAKRYNPDVTDADVDERFPYFKTQPRQTWIISIEHVIENGL